ncbi:MAG: tRNA epoxyqueuosine(34) reductase QueG [Alphaproteobacteria bacterium]|nr:MAG: tRNA epoxyqueuosine(34) reductase QueG [Alphaproteobacteria bacterium]
MAEQTAQDVSKEDVIRALAHEAGFDLVGFACPENLDQLGQDLKTFLEKGYHGSMDWMETHAKRRSHPRALWDGVRSIIMLGMSYAPDAGPEPLEAPRDEGVVSVYALGKDYHDLIKKRLKRVARELHSRFGEEVKVFVDTAPVMEKPLAAQAGIGWQGKHTNLVSTELGSWFFLGSIFTTLELKSDRPHTDHCGSCQACLDACPTRAFPAPHQIDARRCISYLTIEHKGPIDPEFRLPMGNLIYGCDICLSVCPWNKFAKRSREMSFDRRDVLTAPKLRQFAEMDDGAFRAAFAGSPVKRIGRDRFLRNVMIAMGNSGDEDFVPDVMARLGDGSYLVRGMAVWALSRLVASEQFEALRQHYLTDEEDAHVRAEWARG